MLAGHLSGSGQSSKFLRDLQTRREHTGVKEQLDWPILDWISLEKQRRSYTKALAVWEENLHWLIVSPQMSHLPNFCETFKLVASISACGRILFKVLLMGSNLENKEKVALMCSLR